ncbi:ABC transporter permease [Alkaliphilus serpentinus]|uniref:Transport permease protein n=1 Tax=Alkaliphilus serpentinus TaxID=1482731 RepID=A0A833HNR7_9FIRM|nr:ABC transporter permease [Alkaliphilus serpentinus]KAB3529857.1 hypothetical protein F8153_08645 [Alkaliphilus serpentinus]
MSFEGIERFFVQSWLSFKALFGWIEPKTYFFVKVLNPIFQLLFFCLLAKYSFKTNDLTPWVIGNSFLLCIYNSIFGIGHVFVMDRYAGTLKMIIAAPFNKFLTFFQRGFVHIIDSLSTVAIGLIIGSIVFNVSFSNISIPIFIIIALVAMFSVAGLGLLLGSFGLVTSSMNFIANIVSMILIALTGANFPIETLPNSIRIISYCLPITRSIKAANLLMNGGSTQVIYSLIVKEIFVGIVYIALGYMFIIITEHIAKRKATLELY